MTLLFQYGSNCAESQINSKNRLRGDAKFVGIAETLEDYQLAFDVASTGRGCAAADIVPSPGKKVWGVLYDVPNFLFERETAADRGRKSLDAIEGKKYARESIAVRSANGEILHASTYKVISPQTGLRTNLEYVRHIIEGLREHRVPDEYIVDVKAAACANNSGISTEVNAL